MEITKFWLKFYNGCLSPCRNIRRIWHFSDSQVSDWSFTMGIVEKIYLKSTQNYTEFLIFTLERERWPTLEKPGSDIHRLSNRKWTLTMYTVGNLWISLASLSKLEKFQHRSTFHNIKYNSAVLFLSQIFFHKPQSVADPGFSPGGAPTPKSAIIFQFFAENCMKMKEFGPRGGGGGASLAPPPLDPPMTMEES